MDKIAIDVDTLEIRMECPECSYITDPGFDLEEFKDSSNHFCPNCEGHVNMEWTPVGFAKTIPAKETTNETL